MTAFGYHPLGETLTPVEAARALVRFRRAGLPSSAIGLFEQFGDKHHWALRAARLGFADDNGETQIVGVYPKRSLYACYSAESYQIHALNFARDRLVAEPVYDDDWTKALVAAWRLARQCGWPLPES